MNRKRVLILGAAGRDFHNFNVVYREDPSVEVVAFTAIPLPDLEVRRYPPDLAGSLYPQGITIVPESQLEYLIEKHGIDEVVFAYSDISHVVVMHLASQALAAGADFKLLGPRSTMLIANKPVIGVLATRTGCGKSQVSHYIAKVLSDLGKRVIAICHPMPHGMDIIGQRVERFATHDDLERYAHTIKEWEEYESYLELGIVVYGGVDYAEILAQAQAEADFIIWDGGSNDMPFIKPDLWVTVVDPLRASHEILYHPGEANLRAADIILINKVNTATNNQLSIVRSNINSFNPKAKVVEACSKISVDHPDMIRGKRVLCIEDGPTLTYGEMSFGAGQVAADTYGAAEVIDPRNCAVGSMAEIFHLYPHIGRLLPSLGYSPQHLRDLEMSIERAKCDLVLIATPVSLDQLINIKKPWLRVRYELADSSKPSLKDLICEFAHHQIYSKELTKKT